MAVDRENVEKIAKLASLYLAGDDIEKFTKDLNQILDYVQKLNTLKTDEINPTFQVIPIKNVYRDDIVRGSLPQEKFLQKSPEREGAFFKVPKIIEEK